MKKRSKIVLFVGIMSLMLAVGVVSTRFTQKIDPPFTKNVIEQC